MKRQVIFYSVLIGVMLLMAAGCSPRGIRYNTTLDNLRCEGKSTVAVAVVDERPYVVSREKDPGYVGTMRGGYGNPFDQFTESREPLAADMLATVSQSLRGRGYNVLPVRASAGENRTAALEKFGATRADRLLILVLKEWKSDYLPRAYTAERSELFVKAELVVMDKRRRTLAVVNLQEEITLPSGWPEDTVPEMYQRKIRQILDDPRICRNLP